MGQDPKFELEAALELSVESELDKYRRFEIGTTSKGANTYYRKRDDLSEAKVVAQLGLELRARDRDRARDLA
jgi:hypothetical protein